MTRFFSICLAVLSLASSALAQEYLPSRHMSVFSSSDFVGEDLQQLFDTNEAACERACAALDACVGYTFNTSSNACFPKKTIRERIAFEGAVSARMAKRDPSELARADTRAGELNFLTANDLATARRDASALPRRHPSAGWSIPSMRNAAAAREDEGDLLNAYRWMGTVAAQSDAAPDWADYARLLNSYTPAKTSDKRRNNATTLSAAINAYLRAKDPEVQASALRSMGSALQSLRRGDTSVPALKLAYALDASEASLTALNDARAKYGFRITGDSVNNKTSRPQLCAAFSEDLSKTERDFARYVALPDPRLAVEAKGRELCITGVEFGARYNVTYRAGLPAQSGEILGKDVRLSFYVRDRTPQVSFPGNGYVLPLGGEASLPVETVNASELKLTLRHVSDRNLLRAFQDDLFARPLYRYQESRLGRDIGDEIWTGIGETDGALNEEATTRLPMTEAIKGQPAGIYVLSAALKGDTDRYDTVAQQWFVLSDIGLSTALGDDGLSVFVHSITSAKPMAGTKLRLVSRSNRVLAEAETDAKGMARFAQELTKGTGGSEPAMVLASGSETDLAFLSLQGPAFDLSDRGVSGRNPAGALDVFLTTDRGAYRAGETVYATALLRDDKAKAVEGLALTAVLLRPDGVEYTRHLSQGAGAGGHVLALPIAASAPRGAWQLEMRAEADGPALASTTLLVEDFLPERIDFDIAIAEETLSLTAPSEAEITANYLFGAPASDLRVEARVTLSAQDTLEAYPGYSFGRHDSAFRPQSYVVPSTVTGADGRAKLRLKLPQVDAESTPLKARVSVQIAEGSGRPVERVQTRPVASIAPLVGLKPQFEGALPEGTRAGFDLLVLGSDQSPMSADATWTLNRLNTRYQWYEQNGRWKWEPIVTRSAVTSGTLRLEGGRASLEAPADWGEYELVVELDGNAYAAASQTFYAGWYGGGSSVDTPDRLELSLDAESYAVGDEALLRILPRSSGSAMVQVMSDKLISTQMVELSKGENRIPLNVTQDWGTGAYVTVTHITPMNTEGRFLPTRSIGLAYASIDPGAKALGVTLTAPAETKPRQPLIVNIQTDGIASGETAYVTLAAVDAGILNLTGFEPPAPKEHYFGKRKLGVELRDIYGRLIDASKGNLGRVRSGGDSAGNDAGLEGPPPTDALVTFFQGPVTVDADGQASVSLDIPAFNGTLRLMAVAWSPTGVGAASQDVIIRDDIVLTTSLPNFLSPDDTSRMLVEVTHASGEAGDVGLKVSAEGFGLEPNDLPQTLTLTEGGKQSVVIPLRAGEVGDHEITISLTTPGGEVLDKTLTLPVRRLDPEVSQTRRLSLAAGDTLTLDGNLTQGYAGSKARVLLSAGPVAKFDVASLLSELDRYPYGCTEQLTSGTMPLLYFSSVSKALGLRDPREVKTRVEASISRILTRQTAGGSFGMWYPTSRSLWLDAYVTDFLSRAREQGFAVPEAAFETALSNLSNRVNAAPDFDQGGGDLAYALYVLAREGRANLSDLRYYADVKGDALSTPIARAQLGGALAYLGDQPRSDTMFRKADAALLKASATAPRYMWRSDYGTQRRDAAAVVALSNEAGSRAVDQDRLATLITQGAGRRSTQEMVWTLLAAQTLLEVTPPVTLDGAELRLPVLKLDAAALEASAALANTGAAATDITLTTFGVPVTAPDAGGYGYSIERRYFTLEGAEVPLSNVKAGDRLVAHLKVHPFEKAGARLMIDDPLPAGFEIDNPSLLRSGDIGALDWLKASPTETTEFRSDRFLAAVNIREGEPVELAYVVRAITPGRYHHPAATVQDMYRPNYRANTAASEVFIYAN